MEENRTNPQRLAEAPAWGPFLSGASGLGRAAARIGSWLNEHREGIAEIASGLLVIALVQPRLVELKNRFEGSDWEWVIERLDMLDGLALMMLLADGGDHDPPGPALDFIDSALRNPVFLRGVEARLDEAPLSGAQRLQLQAGVGHLGRGEFEAAVPPMIVALEGAFTGIAERRELVRRVRHRMTYTAPDGSPRNLPGAHLLLGLLGLEDDLLAFLRHLVYGARGNAFRHGVATGGHRSKALTLAIATVAYLDLVAPGRGDLLGEAFRRAGRSHTVVSAGIGLPGLTPLTAVAG